MALEELALFLREVQNSAKFNDSKNYRRVLDFVVIIIYDYFLKNYHYILAAISATGSDSRPVRKTLSTSQPRSKPFKRISVDTESDKTYQITFASHLSPSEVALR